MKKQIERILEGARRLGLAVDRGPNPPEKNERRLTKLDRRISQHRLLEEILDKLIKLEEAINRNSKNINITFERMAQMQAQLDRVFGEKPRFKP